MHDVEHRINLAVALAKRLCDNREEAGLAIWKAASEYGLDSKMLAQEMGRRSRKKANRNKGLNARPKARRKFVQTPPRDWMLEWESRQG